MSNQIKVFDQYEKMKLKVASFSEEATMISITNNVDKDSASNTLKQIKKLIKEIDLTRKDATKPYRDFVEKINNAGNEIIDDLKVISGVVGAKLLAYDEELERKRKERLEKINLVVSKIYNANTDDQIDTIIGGLDIDDPKITLAVTQQRQKIKEIARKAIEDEERRKENERLEKLAKEAEEAADEAEAKKKLSEEAKRVEEDRRQRELENRKEEQKEADVLEIVEKDATVDRIIQKQQKQASKVKNKRQVIEFEVTDPDLVPIQYRTVDERKIKAALKSKTVTSIPGVKHERVTKI